MISWEEYLTETVTTFRKEFEKLSYRQRNLLRLKAFHSSFLEPCQIEVLDVGDKESAIWLVIHDNNLPDMTFKSHKNARSPDISEFWRKYEFPILHREHFEKNLSFEGRLHFIVMRNVEFGTSRDKKPQEIASMVLSFALRNLIKTEQVNAIERSTLGLKKSIAKVTEKDVRDELMGATQKIDGALKEIKRIDEEIGKVRQLVGISQEYQDWRLLVSDVHTLKGEHVPREVFDSRIGELNTRIDSLSEIKEAYDKILTQQTEFMKQQSSFIKWIKYATILLPIAVISVPVIEIISIWIRHSLGIL